MPLHWSIEDVENQQEVCWHKRDEKAPDGETLYDIKKLTEALIHMTISIGMSKVTKENFKEFWRRVAMLEETHGPSLLRRTDDGVESVYITLEDVRKHIGMHTNASPMTKRQFHGDIVKRLERRVEDRKRKEERDAEKEKTEAE